MKQKPDWYLLSMKELLILAAGAGIRQYYGLIPGDAGNMTKEEYLDCVFQMTKVGFLETEEDHVKIEKTLLAVLEQIRDAKTILVCYPNDDRVPMRCCYCASRVTMIESCHADSAKVRVGGMEYRELPELLSDASYFPEQISESVGMLRDEFQKQEFAGVFLPAEQVLAGKGVHLIIDSLRPDDGSVWGRLKIMEHPFGYGIVFAQKDEERCFFRKDKLLRYIEILMEGGDHDNG